MTMPKILATKNRSELKGLYVYKDPAVRDGFIGSKKPLNLGDFQDYLEVEHGLNPYEVLMHLGKRILQPDA